MDTINCKQCGAWELKEINGMLVCPYCGTKYALSENEKKTIFDESANSIHSQISLSNDVERLLEKCKTDRKNAKKYANLILDIDPDNEEALKYL